MAKQIDNVTCLSCGCLCDDLAVRIADGQITSAERACSISQPLFVASQEKKTVTAEIEGKEVSLEAAIDRASEILDSSCSPLIWGLAESTIEAQRKAIALADRLGGTVDPALSPFHRAALIALQSGGISTCTLGEVKQRADLVLFWGCDPVTTHPRLFERFIDPPCKFTATGRNLVVVDDERHETASLANEFLQIEPGADFEVLSTLRAIVAEVEIESETVGRVSLAQLQALSNTLKASNYPVLFFGSGIAEHEDASSTLESLFLLVRQLNDHSRCSAIGLGGPIAENVLTWQTGYPCGVNFAAGYPRFDPVAYSARRLLESGEADALLMCGKSGFQHLAKAAREKLHDMPVVLLEPAQSAPYDNNQFVPTVRIPLARVGIHTGGTVFRMDGVPLPLRQLTQSSHLSEEEVLTAILEGVLKTCC